MDTAGHGLRQQLGPFNNVGEHPDRLGVPLPLRVGAHEQEVGVNGQQRHMVREGLHELLHALEEVPARDLGDHPRALRHGQAETADPLQGADGVGAPVLAHEGHRLEGRLSGEDP